MRYAPQAPLPAGFTGRAGVLVWEDASGEHADYAFEPVSRGVGRDWSTLREVDLWPGMPREAVPERTLVDGRGEAFTVRDFLKTMFRSPTPTSPKCRADASSRPARPAGALP